MRELGIEGVRRGRKVGTTRADEKANRPPDLVERRFVATRPNELWVTDLTYVPTWAGMVYVSFITDVFSRHRPRVDGDPPGLAAAPAARAAAQMYYRDQSG